QKMDILCVEFLNFTITVPNEFNFFLYYYNWIDKKRICSIKNIIEQWNLYFERLLNNGEYIQYIEVENSLAEEVISIIHGGIINLPLGII
uniref:hypothetical protein n=1 Tax=Niallia circulans TaxID=1397 RepID=UPI0026EC86CF